MEVSGRDRREGMKAVLCMLVVHVIVAGMNILYKLSADGGRMSLRVLVAYRYMFGAAFLCPLAFFLESVSKSNFVDLHTILGFGTVIIVPRRILPISVWRHYCLDHTRKTRTRLTCFIVGQAFCSAIFGASLNQNLYIAALKMTSATLAVAMTNLLPAFTFVLAVMFRLERLEIRSSRSQAKVLGTAVGVCGAMLLTFYHGAKLQLWSFHTHLPHHHPNQHQPGNQVLGSMLAMANTLSYAIWLIVQAKMSKRYPHPYSSSALLNLFAAIQSTCVAAITDRDPSAWELRWDVNLLTIIYTGILVSGMVVALISWAIQMRGPLFVSAFNPLSLVIVAFFGSIFLDEALHLGSVVGAGLIILGQRERGEGTCPASGTQICWRSN